MIIFRKIISLILTMSLCFGILSLGIDLDTPYISSDTNANTITIVPNEKPEKGDYNENVVLIKTDCFDVTTLGNLDYERVEQISDNSNWYKVFLSPSVKTKKAIKYISKLNTVDRIEYDTNNLNYSTLDQDKSFDMDCYYDVMNDAVSFCNDCNGNINSNLTNDNNKTNRAYPNEGEYEKNIVLLKSENFSKSQLGSLSYICVERLTRNGKWYKVTLPENNDAIDAIDYLNSLNEFESVEYDYILKSTGEISSSPVSTNPDVNKSYYLENKGIIDSWQYMEDNGKSAGGSSTVVVAVIDTGVDYNHVDLRNNIWVNSDEIPNNGIDDDNNGYIDDYYGWDCFGNDQDPMDDNGHGTHVAGIIAAENNDIGTVGVAYNSKIMCIKASNSSGSFSNSDIIEAVQYAYMNGASVINMSFGGYIYSEALEDVLSEAYNQCILVASAGNDSKCNYLLCNKGCYDPRTTYPAGYSTVIGVMSCNSNGTRISNFSNYDEYYFKYNEYNVYAPGESILSTFPNNRYLTMSGTSMSAPIVSGTAALLRSYYSDRNTYSTKYIFSYLTSCSNQKIGDYYVINAFDSLNNTPVPNLRYVNYKIFDDVSISSSNNGNGLVDAGEVIHIGIDSFNITGVASDISIEMSCDQNDGSIDNKYVTILNNEITIPNIGTYSYGDSGGIFNEGNLIDYKNCFTVKISDNCPHNLVKSFSLKYECTNGLNSNDDNIYTFSYVDVFELSIVNGETISGDIFEDTTLSAGKKYLFDNVTINNGVKLEITEGVDIEFIRGGLTNYGAFIARGTIENPITIKGSDALNPSAMALYGSSDMSYVYAEAVVLWDVNKNEEDGLHEIDHCCIPAIFDCYKTNITNSHIEECIYDIYSTGDYCISRNHFNILKINLYQYFNSLELSSNLIYKMSTETNFNTNGDKIIMNNNVIKSCNIFGDFNPICTGNKIVKSPLLQNRDSYGVYHVDLRNDTDTLGDYSGCWPFIESVEIFNMNDEEVNVVGAEQIKIVITFNTSIDTADNMSIYFGSIYPYTDYTVNGEFVTDNVWVGYYTLSSKIENGTNKIVFQNINIHCKYDKFKYYDNPFYTEFSNRYYFYEKDFTIDVSQALSMNLIAESLENGVNLSWMQDDYDTLMGYNVYRSTEKDGNYVKLNTSVISSDECTFFDDNAEPGKTYWYTFTVVLSDMSESKPAGKIQCTTLDTQIPAVYHTPVNQGYTNNNLTIQCAASDNVGIESATLYFRSYGASDWKTLEMIKQNDRYCATIFWDEFTIDGLEYYISVSDGRNVITKGNTDSPYFVLIKDSSNISHLGDVDGNGIITAKDALMVIQAINGDLILTDDQFIRANLNKDDKLSGAEALRILQYVNGNVTTLEM